MISKMTAVLLAVGMLSACGGQSSGTNSTTAAPETTSTTAATQAVQGETAAAQEEGNNEAVETMYDGLMNLTGELIVNEPFTLKIGYTADGSGYHWEDYAFFKDLSAATGITFEFVEYADSNAASLMWASRDYPDVVFGSSGDTRLADASEAGDVYPLEEYLDYAPNWKAYLEENPAVKASITFPDGHIWSLPAIHDRPLYEMRDLWLINKDWLDEVGMDVPTTTDEFYEVLKAFKDNAGKGAIPEGAVPYYLNGITTQISGGLDLICSFGVRVNGESTFATISDDGKIEFNFVNPDIKEPMEYIHKLVSEGLISQDGFTDGSTTTMTKLRGSEPPLVGCYHAYVGNINANEVIVNPLDSGNGKKPIIRAQTSTLQRNKFSIFTTCKYPEIAMRLADVIAEPDWSVYCQLGEYPTYVEKRDDGTYFAKEIKGEWIMQAPQATAPEILSRKVSDLIEYDENFGEYMRVVAAKQYSEWMIPKANLFPTFVFSDENRDRIAELQTDIKPFISSTLSSWALNGGIEEGWDAYINQVNALGLEEYISLLQEEYDRYKANMQ